MDEAATRVLEGPEIIEEASEEKDRPKAVESPTDISDKNEEVRRRYRKPLCGCFLRKPNEDLSLTPNGSPPTCHNEVDFNGVRLSRSFSQEMRRFLSSPVYFAFVIIVTILATIALLMELFMETGLFHASNAADVKSENSAANVSTALHWFSFALLAVFFVEIILRIVVFNLQLVKDYISILDMIVVFIAFLSDLCVTLIAGPGNPIDGISLVVILRLMRIASLTSVKVEAAKRKRDVQIKALENELHAANCKITGLLRQVREKDYEIKQLQAYLGGQTSTDDPHLREAMKNSMLDQDTRGATADADLQMAIALSKQSLTENCSHGIVNKAFTLPKVEDDDLPVLVHERPNRLSSQGSDIEPLPKVTSYMDEYFSKGMEEDVMIKKAASVTSKGAIPKKKSLNSSFRANSNGNNNSRESYDFESALKVLKTGETFEQPITISIDPVILQCGSVSSLAEPGTNKWLDELPTEESAVEPRSTFSSPASDVGSSDENALEFASPQCSIPVKSKMDILKSRAKKSGSSISSESGYLSEDGNGRKRLALSKTNIIASDDEKETSHV